MPVIPAIGGKLSVTYTVLSQMFLLQVIFLALFIGDHNFTKISEIVKSREKVGKM